ncbi:MAG: flagellar motor protein MotD [Candidatus Competibacteraceae bacterium]|nr:flagellar motor protein MotD [Candidatus Competibacteraceae bacterium]
MPIKARCYPERYPSRRRSRTVQEEENRERWMVSYADFITLLFALFVVMYAVSSVNEGKYRVLSESMLEVFRSPPRSMEPLQVGELARDPIREHFGRLERRSQSDPLPPLPSLRPLIPIIQADLRPVVDRHRLLAPQPPVEQQDTDPEVASEPVMEPLQEPLEGELQQAAEAVVQAEPDPLERVMAELTAAMGELIKAEVVSLRRNALWVEVEIKDSILFPSGSAQLQSGAEAPLMEVAAILRQIPNRIQVEGFTDDMPIRTPVYPSNWELSAARAASVVHLLGRLGIRPGRMAAIGYGEHRPVADNATEEGRRRNRRVVLVILGDGALEQA